MKKELMKKIFFITVMSFIIINLINNLSYATEPMGGAAVTVETENQESEIIQEEIEKQKNNENIPELIKNAVARWYYILRLIAIAIMLLLLIFIGIKMALSTVASEKATYKRMLLDWGVGMILVFFIHYIMILILSINDAVVESLEPLSEATPEIVQEYQFGDEEDIKTSSEIETTLYETVRTRAYSLKLTDGFSGLIIYGVLVYYAWKFALIYFRRFVNIIILTLVAPIVSLSYAFNKVLTGKPKIFSTWLSEYIMNVVIQIVHVVIYVSFVSIALQLSLKSLSGVILAFVLLNFMTKADKLIRQIFKISGGKGSLAGDMADRTGFKELKSEAKALGNAMVGGALVKTGMSLATAPLKKGGMVAIGHAAAHMRNKREEKEERERQADPDGKTKKEKQLERDADYFLNSNEETRNNLLKIEELEDQKNKLNTEWHSSLTQDRIDELKAEGIMPGDSEYYNALCNYGINIQKDAELIDKEIKKLEKENRDKFIEWYTAQDESLFTVFKKGLESSLDELTYFDDSDEDSRNHKFKRKNFINEVTEKKKDKDGNEEEVKRKVYSYTEGGFEGGRKGAFWRKKTDSQAIRFRNNMKLSNLFGLNEDEAKVLKGEMQFWQKRIVAMGSMIAGGPAFVINPMLGMGLLGNATITQLDVNTRRNYYGKRMANLNRVAMLKDKSYVFKAYGPGVAENINGALAYHVVDMDKLNKAYKKRLEKQIKANKRYGDYLDKAEASIEQNTNALERKYMHDMFSYEQRLKKDEEKRTIRDLAFEQKASEQNIVDVGNGICMQLDTNSPTMQRFLRKMEAIDSLNIGQFDKVNKIKEVMEAEKSGIIKESIANMCEQNGIIDIAQVQLADADMVQISQNILEIVENTGMIKRGNIELESVNITEDTINDVYLELCHEDARESVNEKLETNLVSTAILEYMEQNGEKNVANLNSQDAKDAIYDIIKDKLMPDDSRQSGSVIKKITGKDAVKDEFELPDEVKDAVETQIKKVKKVKKEDVTKDLEEKGKDELVKKATNRKISETKEKLEEVMHTNNISDLTDEQLDLLFVLSSLMKENGRAEEIRLPSNRDQTKKYETLEKLKYYSQKDGSKRYDESNDESLVVQKEVRELNAQLHGAAIDVIDLIRRI